MIDEHFGGHTPNGFLQATYPIELIEVQAEDQVAGPDRRECRIRRPVQAQDLRSARQEVQEIRWGVRQHDADCMSRRTQHMHQSQTGADGIAIRIVV